MKQQTKNFIKKYPNEYRIFSPYYLRLSFFKNLY